MANSDITSNVLQILGTDFKKWLSVINKQGTWQNPENTLRMRSCRVCTRPKFSSKPNRTFDFPCAEAAAASGHRENGPRRFPIRYTCLIICRGSFPWSFFFSYGNKKNLNRCPLTV
jgi:hypothetical protein